MQGKSIVFLKNVISPVFGEFMPGDLAKNADTEWASALVAAGAAKETSAATQEADQEAAATAGGRLTNKTAGKGVVKQEHVFSPGDTGAMRAAGVLKDDGAAPGPAAHAAAPAEPAKPATASSSAAAAPHKMGGGHDAQIPVAPSRGRASVAKPAPTQKGSTKAMPSKAASAKTSPAAKSAPTRVSGKRGK